MSSETPRATSATSSKVVSSSARIYPDAAIQALDETTFEDVAEVARGVSEELSIACVGPHSADEFA